MLNEKNIEILKKEFNYSMDEKIIRTLNCWQELFINYNSHTNLMSRGDIDMLFEKHVFDSLAILKWDKFKNHNRILDIGTGGGFPGLILAICFPEIEIIANDSRIKKINFLKEAKENLKLNNFKILYSRIEEAQNQKADLIVSRAVSKLLAVFELSKKHLNQNGDFLIYKSKTVEKEIIEFKNKYKNADFLIIPYKLPLEEIYERNLVILLKN